MELASANVTAPLPLEFTVMEPQSVLPSSEPSPPLTKPDRRPEEDPDRYCELDRELDEKEEELPKAEPYPNRDPLKSAS